MESSCLRQRLGFLEALPFAWEPDRSDKRFCMFHLLADGKVFQKNPAACLQSPLRYVLDEHGKIVVVALGRLL